MLDLIDNLYNAWVSRNNSLDEASGQSTPAENGTFDSLVEGLTKPGVLNLSFITEFVKENLGTLMSVLDSLWIVLKGNFSLIVNILTAIFSVLLVGGTAVLNFLVNSVRCDFKPLLNRIFINRLLLFPDYIFHCIGVFAVCQREAVQAGGTGRKHAAVYWWNGSW